MEFSHFCFTENERLGHLTSAVSLSVSDCIFTNHLPLSAENGQIFPGYAHPLVRLSLPHENYPPTCLLKMTINTDTHTHTPDSDLTRCTHKKYGRKTNSTG